MKACKCGSYAINIDPNKQVCDVCYWRIKYENIVEHSIPKIMDDARKSSCFYDSSIIEIDDVVLEEILHKHINYL